MKKSTPLALGAAIMLTATLQAVGGATPAAATGPGPWDVPALQQTPAITWGTPVDYGAYSVTPLTFTNVDYLGAPTSVFAYYAAPDVVVGTLPAVALVHGGGGAAFSTWAAQWAQAGYAAIAMDLFGNGAGGTRLPDGGPALDNATAFTNLSGGALTDMWTYQAVAAVVHSVSVLTSMPQVDDARIGMMGISWGGYLTEIVSGVDDRLAFAIPVYGAGFYVENSVPEDVLLGMSPADRATWVENFDPKQYLPHADLPMLFATGTNDFYFPLDSWKKSLTLTTGPRTLRLIPNWPHDYGTPFATAELIAFADQQVKGGVALPQVSRIGVSGGVASVTYASPTVISAATLNYTTSIGDYQVRTWQSAAATVNTGTSTISATVPADATAYFFTLTDSRGYKVTSVHEEVLLTQRVEAEDFAPGGPGVGYFDLTPANKGGAYRAEGVDVFGPSALYSNGYALGDTTSEWTAYDIRVPSSGAYTFGFRVATVNATTSITVKVDGATVATCAMPNTGGWLNFVTVRCGAYSMTAGQHRVELVQAGYSFAFDYWEYTSKRIEAEDFMRGGEGLGYHDTTAGNAGGAYRLDGGLNGVDIYSYPNPSPASNNHAIGSTVNGEYLSYDAYFPTTGSAPFTFRVGTQSATSQISVYIDGVLATTTSLPNTGNWANYQSVTSAPVSVTSGVHTVKLVFTGPFAFDYFDLY